MTENSALFVVNRAADPDISTGVMARALLVLKAKSFRVAVANERDVFLLDIVNELARPAKIGYRLQTHHDP